MDPAQQTRDWIAAYMAETGLQPTAFEVAKWLGLGTAAAGWHLRAMVRAGRLRRYRQAVGSPWTYTYRLPHDAPVYSEWRTAADAVLDAVSVGGLKIPELAQVLAMDRKTIRGAIDKLVTSGAVNWSPRGVVALNVCGGAK